jgi:hypothetical protein
MRLAAGLSAGSRYVSTFIMAQDILGPQERELVSRIAARAAGLGHPWIGSFTPKQFVALARDAGFRDVRYMPPPKLTERGPAGNPICGHESESSWMLTVQPAAIQES